jgi:MOSC domain-containing protein YiiM
MIVVTQAEARPGKGLTGDRYSSRKGVREVTLIQWEDLARIAESLGQKSIDPSRLRRNIAISGIDLLSLAGPFRLGGAVLEPTGPCDPCHKMNIALGPGGERAMLGRGGITARVISAGIIRIGDRLLPLG